MSIDGVIALLDKACLAAGGQKAWAHQHRTSQSYVCDVLGGRREPGKAILDALGLEKVVTYRASPQREGDRPASPNDGREREPNV